MVGSEASKKIAKRAVKITLNNALAYISPLANNDEKNVQEIITRAKIKMIVLKDGRKEKQDFMVSQGVGTGKKDLT